MKVFYPLIKDNLYTTGFHIDPLYEITNVSIIGNTIRDISENTISGIVTVNYAPIDSYLDVNSNSESFTLNFQEPPLINKIVSLDIGNIILPFVSTSDYFTVYIESDSDVRFSLLCFELSLI